METYKGWTGEPAFEAVVEDYNNALQALKNAGLDCQTNEYLYIPGIMWRADIFFEKYGYTLHMVFICSKYQILNPQVGAAWATRKSRSLRAWEHRLKWMLKKRQVKKKGVTPQIGAKFEKTKEDYSKEIKH